MSEPRVRERQSGDTVTSSTVALVVKESLALYFLFCLSYHKALFIELPHCAPSAVLSFIFVLNVHVSGDFPFRVLLCLQ